MKDTKLKYRIFKDRAFKYVVMAISLSAFVPLGFILYYVLDMGLSSTSWEFLTSLPKPPGEQGGGIANAIVGTILLIAIASAISIPPAILLGLYLSSKKTNPFTKYLSTGIEILQGVPSIVVGIIVYVWVVLPMGGFSTLSGSIALAIMMIPVIAKTAEETLKLIPESLLEASLSLGVPYYKTVLKVLLPSGLSGIITGILLAISRVAGETAPLLFTAFGNPFMSTDVLKPINSLPLLIFNYAGSPYQEWHSAAWGASFVLVMMILILNISAKILSRKWKVTF